MSAERNTSGAGGRPVGHGTDKMMSGEKAKDFKGTVRNLLKYIKSYRIKVIFVFIFAIVSTVFTIVAPAILGDTTDVVAGGLTGGTGIDFEKLAGILLLLTGLYCLSFTFSWAQGYIMAGVSQNIVYELRKNLSEKLCTSAWKSQFLSGLMMPMTQFVGTLAYVGIFILGGYLALHGKISIGNIQAFIQYVRSFNQPISQVANLVNMLQSTAAAAERVFEFMNEDDEADAYGTVCDAASEDTSADRTPSFYSPKDAGPLYTAGTSSADIEKTDSAHPEISHEGRIIFDHVQFGYDPGNIVIRDFSYDAAPGSRVAIVDPTGAGKTTIVKLMLRYYELNGGAIYADGMNIKDYGRNSLRGKFSMALQDT